MIRAGINKAAQSMSKAMVRGLSYYLINENIPIDISRKRFAQVNSFASTPTGVDISQSVLGGIEAEIVVPKGYQGDRCLFFMHGGGFCLGTPKTHRELTGWLAKTLNMKVVVPDYRLAPEHPFPAALDDGLSAYSALLEQGQSPGKVVIGGDSAGANLALVLMLKMKEQGVDLPAAAILYSPWVDLRCTSETYYTKRNLDPVLSGSWLRKMGERYRGKADINDPHLSPVHADLSGLPPVLIQVGGNEVLLNDALLLEQRLRAHKSEVHLTVWEDLWHVFQAYVQYLDISKQALFETREFINRLI